jgi:mono/diheme cytochrome c family protein
MENKMTIRLAAAILALSANAALADTAGPAPKPNAQGPANISGFFSPFPFQGGEAVYKGVCQGCHMADAKGAAGAGQYPALANNPRLAGTGYVLSMIIRGNKGMPPFGAQFTNQQIADLVNYVRSHFGNRTKDEVKPADVQAAR